MPIFGVREAGVRPDRRPRRQGERIREGLGGDPPGDPGMARQEVRLVGPQLFSESSNGPRFPLTYFFHLLAPREGFEPSRPKGHCTTMKTVLSSISLTGV